MGSIGIPGLVDDLQVQNFPSPSDSELSIHTAMEPRPLENKKLLVTGRFEHVDRDTLKQRIEEAGGTILSSISSKLDFLVAGAEAGPSSFAKQRN